MIKDVYIIRQGMYKFFEIDKDTGNWDWTKNLEDATVYATPNEAELIKEQKSLDPDTWIYQMPYSIINPQRKKKPSKPKTRKHVKKIVKKCKCK
jgi:hypothetical protein